MYRASHDTFASTIERLEGELRTIRALGGPRRPREQALWAVTVASVLCAAFALAGLTSALARADDAERRFDGARVRLERKTGDLATCESLAYHELRGDQD
ncbi:MAG TPA: hypothetical protein VGL81_05300 [Polyangiaceae bacterium]|jgi:hypothetical protein